MIKRDDMNQAVGMLAGLMDPEKGSMEFGEKARLAIARIIIEMAEAQIECNRARAEYYDYSTLLLQRATLRKGMVAVRRGKSGR